MSNISVSTLNKYMELGLNIYIHGEAGTGKTQMLVAAAKKNGLKLGYMSAPTLDAYVDLVGIPVAEYKEEAKRKVLEFIRKQDFEDIEVLFIDELPRGELKTLNAIFELIQFGTINGERAIPNLKCVVAAGNPMTDEYTGQQQLDLALLDRFDIYLESDTSADMGYFVNTFGKDIGKALVTWHSQHDHKEKGYLSPRRLEKIGKTWLMIPELATVKAMVPPNGTFNVNNLHASLLKASSGEKLRNDSQAPLAKKIPFMQPDEIRKVREEIIKELPDMNPSEVAAVTEAVSRALKTGIRTETIVRDWAPVLEYFSPADKISMVSEWAASRNASFQKLILEKKISIGKNLTSLKVAF